MTESELERRRQQIEAYARTLIQQLRIMDERRWILEPLLRDEAIKDALHEKFNGQYGGHTYNHLVPMIGQDLARDLVRLFLDTDRRAGSLENIFRKASEAALHRAIRAKFIAIPDQWGEGNPIPDVSPAESHRIIAGIRQRNRNEYADSFDSDWNAVTKSMADLAEDDIATKLRDFRNKYYAHLEMAPLGEDPGPIDLSALGLTYEEIFQFADRYMQTAEDLTRLITGEIPNMEDFAKMHKNYALDFWRIVAGIEQHPEF